MYSHPLTIALATFAVLSSALPAQAKSKADDAAEMQNYRLTAPVLNKLSQVQENVYASIKADPSLAQKLKNDRERGGANDTIDDMVRKIDSMPELKGAIVKAGLTTREYLLATLAMVQAAMAGAAAQNPSADLSRLPPGVKANVAFMQSHRAELTAMQKRAEEINRETRQLAGRGKDTAEPAREPPGNQPRN